MVYDIVIPTFLGAMVTARYIISQMPDSMGKAGQLALEVGPGNSVPFGNQTWPWKSLLYNGFVGKSLIDCRCSTAIFHCQKVACGN